MQNRLWRLALLTFVLSTSAWAETEFSGSWNNRYSTSAHESGDPRKLSSFTSALSLSLRTSPEFWVQAGIGFSQNIDPVQSFNLVNPDFRGFYRLTDATSEQFKIEVGPTTSFALSEESRNESLYFSIGLAARFTFTSQTPEQVGFISYYDLSFNRNIHQYETSTLNGVNTMSSINHYLYFEYAFESQWTIDAWAGFSSAWSYVGIVANAFTLGQEVTYGLTDWLNVTLTHERGGDFLSPSGQTYNFGLFDSNESRYSISTTVIF